MNLLIGFLRYLFFSFSKIWLIFFGFILGCVFLISFSMLSYLVASTHSECTSNSLEKLNPVRIRKFVQCLESKSDFLQRWILKPEKYLQAINPVARMEFIGTWAVKKEKLNFTIHLNPEGTFDIDQRSLANSIDSFSLFEGIWTSPRKDQIIWFDSHLAWPIDENDVEWTNEHEFTIFELDGKKTYYKRITGSTHSTPLVNSTPPTNNSPSMPSASTDSAPAADSTSENNNSGSPFDIGTWKENLQDEDIKEIASRVPARQILEQVCFDEYDAEIEKTFINWVVDVLVQTPDLSATATDVSNIREINLNKREHCVRRIRSLKNIFFDKKSDKEFHDNFKK